MIDLLFPHAYKVSLIEEVPNIDPYRILRYCGKSRAPDEPAVLLRFAPERSPTWIGSFVHGYGSPPATSGVYAWHDPRAVLVVAGGQGYIVDVGEPEKWQLVPEFPITQLVQDEQTQLTVIADFNRVTAYGVSGRRWSLSVSHDGVEVLVKDGKAIAHGFSQPKKPITTVIDLLTGTSTWAE